VEWTIVDSQLRPVPAGMVGELLVAVPGIGSYIRTGDLARIHGDSCVEYRGRRDEQLSIRGLCVAAAVVEAALQLHPAVRKAAVALRQDSDGPRLVAWIVTDPGMDYTESDLRRAMRRLVPEPFVPRKYYELPELPSDDDGEIDRHALPALSDSTGTFQRVQPRTESERLIGNLWQEALGIEQVGIYDNFFELGGHSLLCIQVIARIEQVSGQRLSPRLLLLNTLEQVAAQLTTGERVMEKPSSLR
jgi:nonribosomal peptide synthetase DhbF